MVTYNDYLKNVLTQILESFSRIQEINDKPGDLDEIKKELLKITGIFKVITSKVDSTKITSSDFKPLQSKLRHYLENYYFEQEIDTMSTLYSADVGRIKNMRLKIIEALEEKSKIEDMKDLIEKL